VKIAVWCEQKQQGINVVLENFVGLSHTSFFSFSIEAGPLPIVSRFVVYGVAQLLVKALNVLI
jgi:hypothetical protein